MSTAEDAAWAVLQAACAWRDDKGQTADLHDAVDALRATLDAEPAPTVTEETVPWMDVVADDQVKLKNGTWAPVLERVTRRNGITVTVGMPGATPTDEPVPRTFLRPFTDTVTRRPSPDHPALALLKAKLGARVICSGGVTW